MSSRIRPNPALVVRADTPIGECVRVMKERNTGSVLVVSDTERQEPIGIFTERDLVKIIKLVDEGKHLTKPVRTVMTKHVKTIEFSQLHEALDIMLENGIRHLPVVATDDKGVLRIAGVISMRDLATQLSGFRLRPKKKRASA